MAVIVFMIGLLSPEIIALIGTSEYQVAVYVIPVVTLSVFYTFCYDLFASIEFYYGSTKFVMVASCIGALLNLILNAIFIPIYGFMAAAYTTLICYLILMLMHYLFAMKVLKEQTITEKVYSYSQIFIFIAVASAAGLCSMLIYPYPLLRFSILGVFCAAGIIKRRSILEMIKSIRK